MGNMWCCSERDRRTSMGGNMPLTPGQMRATQIMAGWSNTKDDDTLCIEGFLECHSVKAPPDRWVPKFVRISGSIMECYHLPSCQLERQVNFADDTLPIERQEEWDIKFNPHDNCLLLKTPGGEHDAEWRLSERSGHLTLLDWYESMASKVKTVVV
eukprot:gnl/MRDRNA2_/MRDRNA2_187885_c0_seq1.p1 gnl/MRDRNA2_/MRDRNA2_187885_c0~~gnl/MRDRNA2_/MRDRNA2_187885_c0_seq1.p1  ORF type:complete len:156 (-),score=18.08 gnl/MRDRNA2_/MRDRNA2_187885_c0_seq1:51-518(-)